MENQINGESTEEKEVKSNLQELVEKDLKSPETDKALEDKEEINEDAWNQFVKKVSLGDILDDQMVRAVDNFRKEYLKRNPNEIIDFKFNLKRVKNNKAIFAAVELTFEMERNGSLYVLQKKRIEFNHIREAREGHLWKASLYEAMFNTIVWYGLTYIVLKNDVDTGRIKVPTGA